jgi:hypothetical protein
MPDDYVLYPNRIIIDDSQDVPAAVDMKLDNLFSPLATVKQVESTFTKKSMSRKGSFKRLRR